MEQCCGGFLYNDAQAARASRLPLPSSTEAYPDVGFFVVTGLSETGRHGWGYQRYTIACLLAVEYVRCKGWGLVRFLYLRPSCIYVRVDAMQIGTEVMYVILINAQRRWAQEPRSYMHCEKIMWNISSY